MKKKYIILLSCLAVLILLLCFVEADYQTYLRETSEATAIVEVKEGLSINYIDGKSFEVNSPSKSITFSVTNLTEDNVDYYIHINNVVGDITGVIYELSEAESEDVISNEFGTSSVLSESISAGATERYTLMVRNPSNRDFTFDLNVELESASLNFSDTILAQNSVVETDNVGYSSTEGFIKVSDDAGDHYYFRGNVLNNYVSFANQMWRIVRINPDGTVKLVLDGVTENMVSMALDAERTSSSVFESSQAYTALLNWYNSELQGYDNFIASTTYCYDDSIYTNNGVDIEYLSSYRLFTDRIPTNICNGTSLSLKVALLTADETMYAGGGIDSSASYLNSDAFQGDWWTMTPNKKNGDVTSYISVRKDGILQRDINESTTLFLRPVISLNRQVMVTGDGTVSNPYTIVE